MPFLDSLGKTIVRVFGSAHERQLRPLLGLVEDINRLEPRMRRMSDKDLRAQTDRFRRHIRERLGERDDWTRQEADRVLDELLVDAFAAVREASRRTVTTPGKSDRQPMRHFDVQLIGGMVLHRGNIAEMVTGEGKTLVATLPAYLNALLGKGVHIVTVNDFLARRDRDWMSPMYELLGMTAGAIQSHQEYDEKRAAYQCDITFGYDSEFGFDYLRDNMRWSHEEQVQLGRMYYAIVDEVDSVLIDEARTPLIISGPAEESAEKYYKADGVARRLKRDTHFEVKEKEKRCHLTEAGNAAVERMLGVESIYSGRNTDWPHHIEQALVAHNLYRRDVDYIAKAGEIIIIDEFTGRQMSGRRWSDGLHQAIEAKEKLQIKQENQTLATITYQNFFRLYKKLAGMTGTALTEANEFQKIYGLDVDVIPTNRPLIRREHPDVVYRTGPEKWNAVEEEIVRQHATGRPLLVGTISIENSEMLSERLNRRGIPHDVLNAKHHEREAQIVAEAGQLAHVTIATNMAGRGTDIVLGRFRLEQLVEHWKDHGLAPKDLDPRLPREQIEQKLAEYLAAKFLDEDTFAKTPPEKLGDALKRYWKDAGMFPLRLAGSVAELGGLHIVGTERHEARRIDNQLRGRAGRQGDPGSSRFFVSLEDDVMRIFAGERVKSILRRIGMTDNVAIESRMVSRAIERAQRKVEEYHFDIRKHVLEYDEVMDEQRKTIYGMRQEVLLNQDLRDTVLEMVREVLLREVADAVEGEAAPETRSGRPVLDWARNYEIHIEDDDWRGAADLAAFRQVFRAKALNAWAGRPREDLALCVVASVLDQACPEDDPFPRWDLSFVARWARRLRAQVEAADMQAAVLGEVMRILEEAAEHRYAGTDAEEARRRVLESALETYLPRSSVGAEDWDYEGLRGWGEVLGLRIPVQQWQRVETDDSPEDGEASDYEASRRQEVRTWLEARLPDATAKLSPAEVVRAVVRREAARLLDAIQREQQDSYRPLALTMENAFALGVADSDLATAVRRRRDAIQADLARQIVETGSSQSDDDFRNGLLLNMLETFLQRDMERPGRDFARIAESVKRRFDVEADPFALSHLTHDEIVDRLLEGIRQRYAEREQQIGPATMRMLERYLLLWKIDSKWKDHLYNMDHLREGIGLRAYGQMDPKVEYTREARAMFYDMLESVRQDVADMVLKVDIRPEDRLDEGGMWSGGTEVHAPASGVPQDGTRRQQEAAIAGTQQAEKPRPVRKSAPAVGRNDPCPCGSGQKYKRCCGKAG